MGSLTPRESAVVFIALAVAVAILVIPGSTFTSLLSFGADTSCPLGYGGDGATAPPGHFHFTQSPSSVTYINCSVITSDPANPRASAFSVRGGRFSFVGSAAAAAAAAEGGTVVDLGGAWVTPGLIDPHVHLIPAGLSLGHLNLRAVASKEAFIAAVATAASTAAPGAWILGGLWDESRWGGEAPTAGWIDAVSPSNPVFLARFDAHQGLANSLALAAAGVSAATPDPPGGVIHRDATPEKQPTGLLADAAMQLVTARVPKPPVAERRAALLAAQAHALARGVTAVHDMGQVAFQAGETAAWDDLEQIYTPAAVDGSLKLRVRSFVPLSTWKRLVERVRWLGTSNGRLEWGGVKEFYDGSLGSRTALMHSPYADDPGNSGTLTVELQTFRAALRGADAAGLQISVHAIGDRAVDEVLQAYEALAERKSSTNARLKKRHRIEHAQHLSGADTAARMAALGVVVTPNPLHLVADANILTARLGPERERWAYAFSTLQEAGVRSALATDWPVVELDPLGTLHAAVGGAGRGEGLTPEAALAGITREAAFAGFQEDQIGEIRVGLKADFVVFDGDVLAAAPPPKVLQTFIDGVCEHGCHAAAARTDEL